MNNRINLRRLFEVTRAAQLIKSKYQPPESDEAREQRQAAYLFEGIMNGDPEPLATGELVPDGANPIPAGWVPD